MADVPGLRLPDQLAERARDIEEGRAEPAVSRDASTVVLLRDALDGGIEVYMLRRVTSMPFAPGAYVFPGGSVDARDGDRTVGWSGPSPEEWGAAFGAGETLARELVCAAVRETFEESGVLLAGPAPDTIAGDISGDDWEADRLALLDRSLSLAALLDKRGLVLRSDLLRPWAHWITPVFEERRYDTRFFAAALPAGQRTRDVSTESDQVAWVRPREGVEAARRGEMALLPPTFVTLTELAMYDSVAGVLAAERAVRPRLPETRVTDDGAYLILPPELDGHVPGARP
ncbi:NUDIX hydrolase [Actinoallomurus sp. NPDC050550]|uniref:NUDIX hydrolase n=1 Tax=Actinoallomurus sp. NPDC050550 TaxID=3154937 RepID=UPI0033E440CE